MIGAAFLEGRFSEETIRSLDAMFAEAQGRITPSEKQELSRKLLSLLREEIMHGNSMTQLYKSAPSGAYHLVSVDERCFLLSIYGILPLFTESLFLEGEAGLGRVRWMEADNLVVFELFYIVHSEYQTCVCHYSNDEGAFFYRTNFEKCTRDRYSSDDTPDSMKLIRENP